MKNWFGRVFAGFVCLITPRCREMTRLISAERDRRLPWLTRLRMRWHYGICLWCLRYRDQVGLIGRLSRLLDDDPCHQTGLPEETKERLKAVLAAHRPHD